MQAPHGNIPIRGYKRRSMIDTSTRGLTLRLWHSYVRQHGKGILLALACTLGVSGCTALESVYQSIRQPLQYLPMGDPLSAPWKPKAEVLVDGIEDSMVATNRHLRVTVQGGGTTIWTAFRLFIDGRDAGGGRLDEPWPWSPKELSTGRHEIRVVVRSAGLLRHQVFTVRPVILLDGEAP